MRPARLRPYAACLRKLTSPRRPFSWQSFMRRSNASQRGAHMTVETIPSTKYRIKTRAPPNPIKRLVKLSLNGVLVLFATSLILNFIYEPHVDAKDGKKSDSNEDSSLTSDDGPPPVEGVIDGGDDEEIEEEDGLFIPISWYKEQPLEFYKSTDPEYQEFIKFNKNPPRQTHVLHWINQSIRKFAEINYEEFIGKVDLSSGRYWTDIIYPDGPPPGVYQTGILLTKDEIALVERDVDVGEMTRMRKIIARLWDAGDVLWRIGIEKWDLDRALGRPVIPSRPIEHTPETIKKMKEVHHTRFHPKPLPPPDPSDDKGTAQSDENDGQNQPKPDKTLGAILPPNHPLVRIYTDRLAHDPYGETPMTAKERQAWESQRRRQIFDLWSKGMSEVKFGGVFLTAMMRPMPRHIPRGAIAIVGLTEAVGTKGRVTVTYTCVFQPKNNGVTSVELSFGPVRAHNQWPKGGW